ncbi:hypothetical protein [Sinorhizobium medicae]|uniref:hypothetical protein n=2 Tax=Sinorhizobium medicae TaxID=110321 RepID=UPI001F1CB3C9|nr:hypothetical protein [Sinorhizobium medicae]
MTNRMREQLWRYVPALLELESDFGAEWLLDLWETVPTPDKAAGIREATIAKLLKRHRIRRFDAARALDILRQPPLKVAAGTTESASAHVTTLIARIRLVNRQLKQAHHRLDCLTASLGATAEGEPGQTKQHDVEILAFLPGVGRIVLATLLAEAFDALQRRDYAVVRRQACHDRLATAMYHWARVAVQHDLRSRLKYAALRSRGHSHGRALRSVADRLLAVACAMLKTGTTFDPSLAAPKSAC